jgi:hypothetical protein
MNYQLVPMTDLARIVRLLPRLLPAELAELSARIKALQQTGHAVVTSGDVESDERFVLDAICEALRAVGTDYANVGLLARAAGDRLEDGHSFRDKVPALMTFLATAHPTRIGQRAILLLGLQLLLLDMRRAGLPLGFKLVMAQIHRIGPVLDAHFPGYAEAGLLRKVLAQRRTVPA